MRTAALLAACITPLALARPAPTVETRVGIRAGLNATTVTGDADDATFRSTFHVGLQLFLPVADRVALQPELLFSDQGYGRETPDLEETNKLRYAAVPIALRFEAAPLFHLLAGPRLAFRVDAESEVRREQIQDVFDIEDDIEPLDLGFTVGAGTRLFGNLVFDIRYVHGFTDIATGPEELRTRVIMLSFTTAFYTRP